MFGASIDPASPRDLEANDVKLSEAAERVITLARKVRAYYDAELPNWYPDYPLISPSQEGPPPPKEEWFPNFARDPGTGRPTKKDRRSLDRFRYPQ